MATCEFELVDPPFESNRASKEPGRNAYQGQGLSGPKLPQSPDDSAGRIPEKESAMIELTEQQMRAIEAPHAAPVQLTDPTTKETFVLLRSDEYKRLVEEGYDDSHWTSEERHTLAWEAGARAGWDKTDDYDNIPEQP
jgi:hypothetical protein